MVFIIGPWLSTVSTVPAVFVLHLLRYSALSSSIPALSTLSLSIHLIHPALEDKNSWSMDGFVTFAGEATLRGGLFLAEHSSC